RPGPDAAPGSPLDGRPTRPDLPEGDPARRPPRGPRRDAPRPRLLSARRPRRGDVWRDPRDGVSPREPGHRVPGPGPLRPDRPPPRPPPSRRRGWRGWRGWGRGPAAGPAGDAWGGGFAPPVRSPAAPRARAHEARHPQGGPSALAAPPGRKAFRSIRKAVRSI